MIERFLPEVGRTYGVPDPIVGGLVTLIVVGVVTLVWVAILRGGDR